MRVLLSFLMLAAIAGCRCSPATPQPVTLRVVNTTRSPIYVDASGGKLGLTVKRDINGTLFGFDDLACECRYCENACTSSCSCPDAGVDRVLRIEAGKSVERTWDGVVQVAGSANCAGSCLDQVNAPLNEPFTVELCFAAQRPNGIAFDDAGVGNGQLPRVSTSCTTRVFAPQDLEVEIGPARGAACMTTAECKGEGELCLDGACTTGCPANDFPQLGSDWILTVASPDNMGFFEMSARGTTGNQYSGTGTLTSAVYQSNSLLLSFSRPGTVMGEMLTGRVQIKMPIGTGAPLTAGKQVIATVLDDGDDSAPSRAFVMKDALTGDILFAADMAQGKRLLEAMDLGPFSVSDSTVAAGCSQTSCGRLLYFPLRFTAGAQTIELNPGAQGELSVGSGKWNFLNVSSGAYEKPPSSCPVKDLRPFAFWKLP